jgi:predicted amidophosphoribosyltransferase
MIKPGVRRTTDLFYMFKTGRKNLAFVFALAIFTRLASAGLLEIDAVVPIPLSPDKASAGELHRTLHLARELGRMLTAPVSECLHLSRPISKRWLRGALGYSAAQFEDAYRRALVVTRAPVGTLLLVDDTCTEGSTLRVASAALATAEPIGRIVAATAAQMAVKAVVTDVNALLVLRRLPLGVAQGSRDHVGRAQGA